MATLVVMIAGKNITVNVTKSTTCDDVIRTLLNQKLVTFDSVAMFHMSDGVEKRVRGKTQMMKLVRAAGAKRSGSFLSVRQEVKPNKSDKHILKQFKSTVRRVKNTFTKNRDGSTMVDNMDNGSKNKSNVYSKDFPVEMLHDPTMSKLAMMKRYMNDVMTYSPGPSGRRSRGDGISFCDNMEDLVSMRDDEEMLDDTCVGYSETHSDMNEAFLNEPINDTVTEINPDLNVCMINEDCFSEAESAFDDDSDIDSVNELDRNMFTTSPECGEMSLERIRKLFGSGEIPETSLESVLESFMNTLSQQVHQSDDEGVSSMGSDLL